MLNISEYENIKGVIRHFESISKIPHGSGNTQAIADYLVSFAKERGLDFYRDGADNVVIRKPATRGYEDRPAVIFQGHLDMVEARTDDCTVDMKTEGLELYRDGDFLRARGTTLGGDDGVALAYAMEVLDDDSIEHPDFEAVFTSDEEIGLIGAVALAPEAVKGRLLINIDSDAEGVFTVGCAGGVRSDISLPVERRECDESVYALSVSGFRGGHSGVEIDKGRENAIKALATMLGAVPDLKILDISGGNADNAIPRSAQCRFASSLDLATLERLFGERLKAYKDKEPEAAIAVAESTKDKAPLTLNCSLGLVELLMALPSGVVAMSADIQGLVETSLNMGILELGDSRAEISFSVRSAKGAEKEKLCRTLAAISAKYGADYSERGVYPAWEYRADSHLRDVMQGVYEEMYGRRPEVIIIHAGLECGIFSEKLEGLDCVSIGPDNFDIHTTEERLSLSSMSRVWEFLKAVLKNI